MIRATWSHQCLVAVAVNGIGKARALEGSITMSLTMGRLKAWGAVAVCVVLLTSFSTSSRAVVTNLTNGGSISFSSLVGSNAISVQVGDKLFSDFSFGYTQIPISIGPALTPSSVSLAPLINGDGFGFSLQLPLIATDNEIKDIKLDFSVTVLDPNQLISDVHLAFTSSVSGHGIASITESVFTNGFGAGQIASLDVKNPGNPNPITEDTAFLSVPQQKIWIEKDIIVDANGTCNNSWSLVSIVDQTFSQIPEPSTIALSLFGLVACFFAKRRK